jgi:hypothetical protein
MLSLAEKLSLKLRTGWTSAITDYIRDMDEANVYIKAGLKEGRVNGKAALLNPTIVGEAYNCRNWYGRKHPEYWDWCNADLMGEGYPPHDENGDPFELHHIGQQPDSPLAELTAAQHHDDGNFQALHQFDDYSSIERDEFTHEREQYWMARFQDFKDCYSRMS